jgi:hypothetical protein
VFKFTCYNCGEGLEETNERGEEKLRKEKEKLINLNSMDFPFRLFDLFIYVSWVGDEIFKCGHESVSSPPLPLLDEMR